MTRHNLRRTTLLLGLGTGGCKLDEAPPTLDAVFKGFWLGFDDAPDDDLGDLLAGTLEILDVDALSTNVERGSQARLQRNEIQHLTFLDDADAPTVAPDPTTARPVYLIERYDCTLAQYLPIMVHDDQNELYGTYEAYSRHFFDDPDAFVSGDSDTVSWEGDLTTSLSIFGEYQYHFFSDARRVPVPDDLDLPDDHFYLTRSWIPRPAEFTRGNGAFPQDYQFEVFLPISDTEVVHLYPVWRQLEVSIGDMESDAVADFNVDQMVKWGRRTEELCQQGLP